MDFERLADILPRPTHVWSIEDTQKWIDYAGLHMLAEKFRELGIDGSCIHFLTEDDLRSELGIKSNIMVRKMMIWINQGFKNYDQYLGSLRLATTKHPESSKIKKMEINSSKKIPKLQQFVEQAKREETHSDIRNKNIQNQLIVRQVQTSQNAFYSFKNKGGVIGRNALSQMAILDEFVSRFHAEITYDNGDFYLHDCGSYTGTFIRITEKVRVYNGIVLEIGSNQFEVTMSDKHLIGLRVIEGPNEDFYFPLPKKNKITIGRKAHNQIHFPEDHHLSNIHGTFFSVNGVWYAEDLGSTNGTWIRLSKEGQISEKWKLQDKTQFKISSTMTYECRRNYENRKTEKERSSEICIFCKESNKNAIILPCKHNTCCYDCVNRMKLENCQRCGAPIAEVIKIFKV